MVLVDSDILMEVARGRNRQVVAAWLKLSESDRAVLYCAVNAAELWAGARPEEQGALSDFFGALTCVPIDEEVGRLAGAYLREFRKSHGVEMADALVAACAVRSSAELWTRNRKHYPMGDVVFFE